LEGKSEIHHSERLVVQSFLLIS